MPFDRNENQKARGKLVRQKARSFNDLYDVLARHASVLLNELTDPERVVMQHAQALRNRRVIDHA